MMNNFSFEELMAQHGWTQQEALEYFYYEMESDYA